MHAAIAVSGVPDTRLYEGLPGTCQGQTVYYVPISRTGERHALPPHPDRAGEGQGDEVHAGNEVQDLELRPASAAEAVATSSRMTLHEVLQAGWTGVFHSSTVDKSMDSLATTVARLHALRADGKAHIITEPRVRRPTRSLSVMGADDTTDDNEHDTGPGDHRVYIARCRPRDRTRPFNPSEVALLELTKQCSQRLTDEVIHFVKHPHLVPDKIRWNTGKEMLDDALKGIREDIGIHVQEHTFTDG